MASGWNLWVRLECIGLVSGCCCKAWFTIRRTATRRGAACPCSQCLVLSGSERDVHPTTPVISTCTSYVLYMAQCSK